MKDNALFGTCFITSGLIGSAISGIVIDKHPQFRRACIFLGVITTLSFLLVFLTIDSGSVFLLSINFSLIGLGIIPIMPVCFALGVELTYPTPEGMANGMMLLPSKIYGAILGVIAGALSNYGPFYVLGLFIANTCVTTVASYFIKEDLRRINMIKNIIRK